MNKNSSKRFSIAAIMRCNDQGIALPMVLLVFVVGVALIGAFLVAVVGSANVSNTTRSGIQAQAAAEAGVAHLRSEIFRDGANICDLARTVVRSDSPVYVAKIYFGESGSTSTACPSADTKVRLVSEGEAGGARASVEEIRSLTVEVDTPETNLLGAQMLYTFGSPANWNFTIDPNAPSDVVVGGDFLCNSTIPGNLTVRGNLTNTGSGCHVKGDFHLDGRAVQMDNPIQVDGDMYVAGSGVSTFNGTYNSNITLNGTLKVSSSLSVLGDVEILGSGASSIDGVSSAKINGEVFTNGTITIGWSGIELGSLEIAGSGSSTLTAGTYFGPVRFAGTYSQGSNAMFLGGDPVNGAIVTKRELITPQFPTWIDYTFDISGETYGDYDVVRANCEAFKTVGWSGLADYSQPTIIDATKCTGISNNDGRAAKNITIGTDLIFVVTDFYLNGATINAAPGQEASFSILKFDTVSDSQPTCSVPGAITLGGVKLNGVSGVIYTPCGITGWPTTIWNGQMYAGTSFNGNGFTLKFTEVGLPAMIGAPPEDPENPIPSTNSNFKVSATVLSARNIDSPGLIESLNG